jgi:tetratricopeptide (TPR) repeat protein
MIVFASYALCWLFQQGRRSPKVLGYSVVFAVFIFGATWPGWFDAAPGSNGGDYINRGNVLRKTGQSHAALVAYQEAEKMNPQDPEGWFLTGTTALNLGQPEQAISHLRHAAILEPHGADILLNLGNAYFLTGQRAEAQHYYESLIALNRVTNLSHKRDSVASAHLGLRQICLEQAKSDEARQHMESAWNVDEQLVAEYCVINGLELTRSAEVFDRLARAEPWNWYPRANVGMAYFKQGQFTRAVEDLKTSAGLRGALPGVRFYLGLALIKTGRDTEGREILQRLLVQLPESALRSDIQKVLNN